MLLYSKCHLKIGPYRLKSLLCRISNTAFQNKHKPFKIMAIKSRSGISFFAPCWSILSTVTSTETLFSSCWLHTANLHLLPFSVSFKNWMSAAVFEWALAQEKNFITEAVLQPQLLRRVWRSEWSVLVWQMQGFPSARACYSYARDLLGASAPANAAAMVTS